VGGSFASGALFFLLNLAHTKALSKNTEDLHGSARWATKADIEETSLIQARRGVYVGGWYEQSIKHLHYLRHNGPEHILAFAPTRSGKGVASLFLHSWPGRKAPWVYDIKGEIGPKPRVSAASLDKSVSNLLPWNLTIFSI